MSSITVYSLDAAGLSLFNDQESYLDNINDAELAKVNGGVSSPLLPLSAFVITKALKIA